ncbi:hypothetical protein ACLB2K_057412 [Fragaria x ananassa]
MRKGAKRKARPAATEAKPKATATRAKRAAFPVGTEWDRLDSLYQYDWDFSNLEKEFEEEGGKFHGIGNNKVYLFSQTETSSPSVPVLIPTLVAVVAPRPPSMEIGIRSVQREEKEIVPMRQMKMDWIPYIPLEQREGWNSERGAKSGSNLPQIFVLGCTQRKASLKQMKEDRWMKFQYCMPYLMNPNEEEKEQTTVVDILFPREPQAPLFVQFDWEFDEVEEYTDELIKAEELTEDKKEAFMAFVKEEVKKVKKKIREEKEAKKKLMEDPKEVLAFPEELLRLGFWFRVGGFGEGVGEAEGSELGGEGFGGEGVGEGEEVDGWEWILGFTDGLKEAIGGKMRALVGLLGLGRELQRDLDRIANTAETTLALLRHPDYCISGYSSVSLKRSIEDAEKGFNQLSIEERGKFDEETLVNVNSIRKRRSTSQRSNGFRNEYIVITILVAAEGVRKLPAINGSGDLKEALQKLASIPPRKLLAVEVLWTPQNENDTI